MGFDGGKNNNFSETNYILWFSEFNKKPKITHCDLWNFIGIIVKKNTRFGHPSEKITVCHINAVIFLQKFDKRTRGAKISVR